MRVHLLYYVRARHTAALCVYRVSACAYVSIHLFFFSSLLRSCWFYYCTTSTCMGSHVSHASISSAEDHVFLPFPLAFACKTGSQHVQLASWPIPRPSRPSPSTVQPPNRASSPIQQLLSVRLVDGFIGMGWDHPHLQDGNLG
jgi:hypothetical protein